MYHLGDPWSQSWIHEHFSLPPNHNGNLIENNKDFGTIESIFRSTTCRWRRQLIFSGSIVPMSTIDWWDKSLQLPRSAEIPRLEFSQI